MHTKYFTLLREDNPETGGTGVDTSSTPNVGANPFQGAEPQQEVVEKVETQPTQQAAPTTRQTTTPTAPVAPSTVNLTPEQLATLMRTSAQPVQTAAPAAPAMTEADFKKAFNVFEATPELYEQLLGVKPDSPARVATLNNILQAVSRQSVTIMRHLQEKQLAELKAQYDARLAPVAQSHQEAQEQKYYEEFSAEYPGLKDFKPLLAEIVTAAQARGTKFANLAEAKNFVATQACKLLGKDIATVRAAMGTQQVSTTAPSVQAPVQQPVQRRMSTMSMGGRSGTSGATPVQSTAERLFASQA